MSGYMIWTVSAGIAGLIAGIRFLINAKNADSTNYSLQKAKPLPLSLVNVRDSVWLSGKAVCPNPLVAPHFALQCLHYDYHLEELITETHTDKKGREHTKTKWITKEKDSDSATFELKDEDASISINGENAEFRNMQKLVDCSGDLRHTVEIQPFPAWLNAMGSISEDKKRLEKFVNTPLIVTSVERQALIDDAEQKKNHLLYSGYILLLSGLTAVLYILFDYMSVPVPTNGSFRMDTLLVALLPASLVLLLYWIINQYNVFITFRKRVDRAWHQTDLDLQMRYDIIPLLLTEFEDVLQHENGLIERMKLLRTQWIAAGKDDRISLEGPVAAGMDRVAALLVEYPEYKNEETAGDLIRKLKSIESRIAHSKRVYNATVKEHNDTVNRIPAVLIARPCGFLPLVFFPIKPNEVILPGLNPSGNQ